ncbi:DUF1801 domain-containing protein [Cellulophaga baltica]|uniref:DUF1801 domain-containing protein n=1 Tax=Cellulophaga TaxID=104264 RepID=UPI001C069F57|nr:MULTISPECIES: DUF1801 domain-containing protein [Cellulophaga]MBU2994894.1 DUF1801 domain-containing protein [Cellulophaga baltica]MDO6766288.1 DUF1801 domain-containing protein [Cellulophaga sp. 1_MG-2023]
MSKESDHFYLKKSEPDRSCFLALRQIILHEDNLITETIKYGIPCFCYKNKIVCYLNTDKKTKVPYLLMVEGKHLNHPKLEAGNRVKMKIFKVNPHIDIPIKEIQLLLNEALDLYKNGIIKTKD